MGTKLQKWRARTEQHHISIYCNNELNNEIIQFKDTLTIQTLLLVIHEMFIWHYCEISLFQLLWSQREVGKYFTFVKFSNGKCNENFIKSSIRLLLQHWYPCSFFFFCHFSYYFRNFFFFFKHNSLTNVYM